MEALEKTTRNARQTHAVAMVVRRGSNVRYSSHGIPVSLFRLPSGAACETILQWPESDGAVSCIAKPFSKSSPCRQFSSTVTALFSASAYCTSARIRVMSSPMVVKEKADRLSNITTAFPQPSKYNRKGTTSSPCDSTVSRKAGSRASPLGLPQGCRAGTGAALPRFFNHLSGREVPFASETRATANAVCATVV